MIRLTLYNHKSPYRKEVEKSNLEKDMWQWQQEVGVIGRWEPQEKACGQPLEFGKARNRGCKRNAT